MSHQQTEISHLFTVWATVSLQVQGLIEDESWGQAQRRGTVRGKREGGGQSGQVNDTPGSKKMPPEAAKESLAPALKAFNAPPLLSPGEYTTLRFSLLRGFEWLRIQQRDILASSVQNCELGSESH